MSIESALLAQARGPALVAKARSILRAEVIKGCQPEIAPRPVAMEPVYEPIGQPTETPVNRNPTAWVFEAPVPLQDIVRLQVWVSPEQRCDWNRSERFLKQLFPVKRRIGLEIVGNRELIEVLLLCHRDDLPVVQTAFYGEFERCRLTPARCPGLAVLPSEEAGPVFRDFLPPPPYSHLLTQPDELHLSPYGPIMTGLACLDPPAVGLYQVLVHPVSPDHDWHHNVQRLLDLEFAIKLMTGWQPPQRYAQQVPSGDLRHMATDTECKAHNDKPFFAAAMRVAVIGASKGADQLLRALSTFSSLIQHGGRPLDYVTETDYQSHLRSETMLEMFAQGLTYRPGFLVNSLELTSLVHIPSTDVFEHRPTSVRVLETLPANPSLSIGTPIGTCSCAGRDQPVCIPAEIRTQHLHVIGRTGCGKSTLIEHMIQDDIEQGHGVAVLDPHGRLVQRMLCLLDARHVDRVIYINPGDRQSVPIWNPLRCSSGQVPGRVADDIVSAFKSFVSGWGDRLEHLLRHALIGVLHLPQGNLLDVFNLLRKKSDESDQLRRQVVKLVQSEVSRQFWRTDFDRYGPADLAPPQHKLSKLLTSGTVSLMLSQPESSFDFRDVMDSSKILLIDLSDVGPEAREIMGCFVLSLLHLSALSRGQTPEDTHKPFHIYCDEAHRFLTDAIEDLIAETRKFNVSLTLAHQFMDQFGTRKTGAISSVGSAVIFNVDNKDAMYLKKDLQGRVPVEDLITLQTGEAIARIGTEIVRVQTPQPLVVPEQHNRDRIIERSRAQYYRPFEEVQKTVRNRNDRWVGPFAPLTPGAAAQSGGSTESSQAADGTEMEVLDYDLL